MVRRNAFAHCPFSAAIERAERYLREAMAQGRIDELVVDTTLSSILVEDYTDPVRRHDALEFSWQPRSGLFPSGRSLLTVRPHAPQGTELQLSISYLPPLGPAGKAFDATIGRYIAGATCAQLLQRLKREVEKPS